MKKDRPEDRENRPEIREWAERLRRNRTPEPEPQAVRATQDAAWDAVQPGRPRWSPRRRLVLAVATLLVVAIAAVPLGFVLFRSTGLQEKLSMKVKVDPSMPLSSIGSASSIDPRYIASLQSLGTQVLAGLAQKNPGKNQLLSPVSLSMAFSLCMAGAVGDTQEEMRRALQYGDLAMPAILSQNRLAYESLYRRGSDLIEVLIANSVWCLDGYPIQDPYLDTATKDFYSSVRSVSSTLGVDPVALMNQWVKKQTNGMIPKAIEQLDPRTVLVLIDAVYFHGDWAEPFNKLFTKATDFHRSDGTVVTPQTMFTGGDFQYRETPEAVSVVLPYFDGMAMVLTPHQGGAFDASQQSLVPGLLGWKDWESGRISIALPKFNYSATLPLDGIMQSLGMKKAYLKEEADFSAMSPVALETQLHIGTAFQKTAIDLNEKGTVASAATVIEMDAGGVFEPLMTLDFNRPFWYAIVDKQGVPLFMGVVEDPTATEGAA